MNKKSARRNSVPQERRAARFSVNLTAPMVFCVVEAVALLSLILILELFFDVEKNPLALSIIFAAALTIYVFSAGTICIIYAVKASRLARAKLEAKQIDTEIYDVFRYVINLPYAIIDANGSVKIMNGALQDLLGYKNAVSNIDFSEFCSVSVKSIISNAKNRDAYISDTFYNLPGNDVAYEAPLAKLSDGRRYEVESYVFKNRGENYYFVTFKDTEDLLCALEREENESAVVAYVMLDNLKELAQYVRADYRSASVEIENILKSWISQMNGFIKEYENDKYIAVFSKQELDKQMENDFDIQQKIMTMKIGDNSFPVTVSMGISAIRGDFKTKEKAASDALDIAIGRGGNQVAVKRGDSDGYVFFGGTHKTIENNTAILSRVSGEILEKQIRVSSNVLVMGHANPDFDSIGSCVGAARFAMAVLEDEYKSNRSAMPSVNIVIDKNTDSFATCYSQLEPLEIYDEIFISKDVAKDLVSSDTTLILCDVNNPVIYEAPELMRTVQHIAVLDHHRLASALPFTPFLQFIEATKSSASEIVSEILMRSSFSEALHKEEAEVLLSGIMLDTNNFTRNAGAQTFEITQYLYACGAHTGVVRDFFNESLEELMLTGEFESKVNIFRECIAITSMSMDHPSTPEDRVVASKVADKLLNIKGVQASFALIHVENDVVISGRSNGNINVQLILERLKGGGHFDIAGAQVRNSKLSNTIELLTDAIDDYFEYDHQSKKN